MAWTYEQKFNAYSDAALQGQDSWDDNSSGSASPVINTTAPAEGAKAVYCQAGTTRNAYHDIGTLSADFTFYISLRSATRTSGTVGLILIDDADASIVQLSLQTDGKIYYWNSGGATDSGLTWTADTYLRLGVDVDWTNGRYRLNKDGGAWSSYCDFIATPNATLDRIRLWFGATPNGDAYMDWISPNYALSNIKKLMGVAQASIKEISGITNANTKKVAGVSNA